jgi:hypothetical protein
MTRITITLHEDQYTFLIVSRAVLLRMGNDPDKDVEEIKTHILCSVTFSHKSYRLGENVKNCDRSGQATNDNIIWRMRTALWIAKATHTRARRHARTHPRSDM